MSTSQDVWKCLKNHYYHVIFISPEMLLNSKRFQRLYYSTDFQKHLVLRLIDEAHVIYLWGLVASGLTKGFPSHTQLDGVCKFRPKDDNLGQALTAMDNIPVL
ncbi:hypothetical protein CROQUDRAFT_559338 [Cronartium quercuum f. sp. fusiforme G11]|nr:hypothetical protein CROQUDRAFT_559338 [Cronartium quercuum f. sp. fusiforme G11]